jgi:hypothetical protein
MANTLWCGREANKLYLEQGEFDNVLLDSVDVSGKGIPLDITNTVDDTLWTLGNKYYHYSGKITSTLKTSQDMSGVAVDLQGMATDSNFDILGCDTVSNKFYLTSGIFTTTVKTSHGWAFGSEQGISYDQDGNTFYCDRTTDKLYVLSGVFTSTVKSSLNVNPLGETSPKGISSNGTDTFCTGDSSDLLRRYSGKITSTLKDSRSVAGIDNSPSGIESDDVANRIGAWIPPIGVAAAHGYLKTTISWNPVVGATSYNIYWDTSPGVLIATGTKIEGVTSPYDFTPPSQYGILYYYVVTAYNVGDGETSESAEVSAIPYRLNFSLQQAVNTNDIVIQDSTGYYFAAANDGVYRSTDNGATWVKMDALDGPSLQCCVTDNNYVYAVTNGGRVYYSDDDGATFAQAIANSWRATGGSGLSGIAASGNRIYVAGSWQAGHDPALSYSDDYGATWTKMGSLGLAAGGSLHKVLVMSADGSLYVTTQTGAEVHYYDGSTWSDVSDASELYPIIEGDDNIIYAGQDSGDRVRARTAGGWSNHTSAAMPGPTVKVWDLAYSYGLLYAATDSVEGRLYKSDTNNTTWENMYVYASETEVYCVCIDCDNSYILTGSQGGIYRAPLTILDSIATLAATGGRREVELTWTNVPGAISYNLYYSTTSPVTKGTGTKITGVTTPYTHTITDSGLWDTTIYYVITTESCGGESDESNEVSAIADAGTPLIPQNLVATALNSHTIQITWDSAIGALSYILYWGLTPGITTSDFSIAVSGTTFNHVGRTPGMTYYYAVVGVGSTANSDLSNEDDATPPFNIDRYRNMLAHLLPKGRFWQK